ncbi:MAG TPA: hypothetical protein VMB50_18015 [Myxococcales bacterium]|nr:hypothetical protein [Myxococcales bacterium]
MNALVPLALLASLVGSATAKAEKDAPIEGLLLGVRTRFDFDHPQPTTFFVTADGIRELGPGLAVPRRGGFLWVGDAKEEKLVPGEAPTLVQYARLTVTPAAKKPKRALWVERAKAGEAVEPAGSDGGNAEAPAVSGDKMWAAIDSQSHACDDDGGDAVTYAGGDLISFQSRRVSFCGGADPDTVGDLTTWRLGPVPPARVTAGQMLGPATWKKLFAEGTADASQRERLGDPDEKMWGLVHEQGVWVLEGGRPRSTGSNGPSFGDFTLAAPLPRRWVGDNKLDRPWAEYQKLDPEAGDVVDSPSGRVVVFFDRDAIRLFVGGQEKGRVPFKDPQVVMAQWSIGPGAVARIAREATAAVAP